MKRDGFKSLEVIPELVGVIRTQRCVKSKSLRILLQNNIHGWQSIEFDAIEVGPLRLVSYCRSPVYAILSIYREDGLTVEQFNYEEEYYRIYTDGKVIKNKKE